jgi:pyruvate dehydrogenase E1 component alpha subunit
MSVTLAQGCAGGGGGTGLTREQLLQMYRTMVTIRGFEGHIRELWKQDFVSGTCHTYVGEEAVAAGVCTALRPDDCLTSTHRGHGHCIAKGADLKRMMAELMGRESGYCHGKGGSMHIADFEIGILGACGIVAGGVPMSVGAGLSAKMRGTDQVVICFFGDGAVNQGSWHEAMNLAAIWKVPTVFVCENNGWGVTMSTGRAVGIENLADRAVAYGIPGAVVEGMDPVAVYDAASAAIQRARRGEGPSLIECKTYRFEGHWIGDDAPYRSKEEVLAWRARDPIPAFEARLIREGLLSGEEAAAIKVEVEKRLAEAIDFAKASPEPAPESLFEGLYA